MFCRPTVPISLDLSENQQPFFAITVYFISLQIASSHQLGWNWKRNIQVSDNCLEQQVVADPRGGLVVTVIVELMVY